MQDNFYETRDLATAAFLRVNGHYCIGTVPAGNKNRPQERNWLFERTPKLVADLDVFQNGDPLVPVKRVFSCSTILKNLLNDKDNFEDNLNGEQQK